MITVVAEQVSEEALRYLYVLTRGANGALVVELLAGALLAAFLVAGWRFWRASQRARDNVSLHWPGLSREGAGSARGRRMSPSPRPAATRTDASWV
jgi:hypothetical protein